MARLYSATALCVLIAVVCSVNVEGKRTLSEILRAQAFLRQYHYLSFHESGNHDMKTALEMYQRFFHLPVTGQLDETTYQEMQKPRCGFPDMEEDDNSGSGIRKRYGISSKPWKSTSLTYKIIRHCEDLSKANCERVIAKAFKLWSDNSNLKFTKVASSKNANIKIGFYKGRHPNCTFPFDGPGNVLAHALFPYDGRIHFDEDETFTDGSRTGKNLLSIAVHEIGHAIGISHSTFKGSVMYAEYKGYNANLQLHTDDINAVAYLYGGGSVPPMATQPPTCRDLFGNCAFAVDKCKVQEYEDAMRENCPKTCGFCGGAGNIQPCKDIWSTNHCRLYKKISKCNYSLVKPNCRKTCFNCT